LAIASNKLKLLFVDLVVYSRQNTIILLKYLYYLVNSTKLVYDVKRAHFIFIIKFLAFLNNKAFLSRHSNGVMRYFFNLIYSISLNYRKINSFRHILVVRLMKFLDMW
jgi:hypothetical protein